MMNKIETIRLASRIISMYELVDELKNIDVFKLCLFVLVLDEFISIEKPSQESFFLLLGSKYYVYKQSLKDIFATLIQLIDSGILSLGKGKISKSRELSVTSLLIPRRHIAILEDINSMTTRTFARMVLRHV